MGDDRVLQTVYGIDGMTCDHCAKTVGAALRAMAGVVSVEVDPATGAATVRHQLLLAPGDVAAVVSEAGYVLRP